MYVIIRVCMYACACVCERRPIFFRRSFRRGLALLANRCRHMCNQIRYTSQTGYVITCTVRRNLIKNICTTEYDWQRSLTWASTYTVHPHLPHLPYLFFLAISIRFGIPRTSLAKKEYLSDTSRGTASAQ